MNTKLSIDTPERKARQQVYNAEALNLAAEEPKSSVNKLLEYVKEKEIKNGYSKKTYHKKGYSEKTENEKI